MLPVGRARRETGPSLSNDRCVDKVGDRPRGMVPADRGTGQRVHWLQCAKRPACEEIAGDVSVSALSGDADQPEIRHPLLRSLQQDVGGAGDWLINFLAECKGNTQILSSSKPISPWVDCLLWVKERHMRCKKSCSLRANSRRSQK